MRAQQRTFDDWLGFDEWPGAMPPLPAAPPGDVCARKHGGNRQSRAANRVATPHKASMRERVRVAVAAEGYAGMTLRELSAQLQRPMHALSGRVSELKGSSEVWDSQRQRDGCAVLVAQRRWVGAPAAAIEAKRL